MHFDGAYEMLVVFREKIINFGVPVAYVDEFAPRILLQYFIALCMALLQANLLNSSRGKIRCNLMERTRCS